MARNRGQQQATVAAAAHRLLATTFGVAAALALVAATATSATSTFMAIGSLSALAALVLTFVPARTVVPYALTRAADADPTFDADVIVDAAMLELVAGRELLRARRYERPLTAVSVALDVPAADASHADEKRVAELANELARTLREVDYVACVEPTRVFLVLPETSGQAASALTRRILAALDDGLRDGVCVGLASFPDDEVTWIALRDRVVDGERPYAAWADGGPDGDGGSDGDGTSAGAGGAGGADGDASRRTRARRARRTVRGTAVRAARASTGAGRRAIDVAVVLAAAPFVLPIVLVAAVLIKLETPGPILIRHVRVGRGGKPVAFLKLRTMVRNAEELKAQLAHLNMLVWPDFKIANDPRVTRVGRWLRRTSIDELPQLWNLLRGDITLIGPRPCSIGVDSYRLWQTERLEATPGLFGRWQAEGRGRVTFDDRCRMDIRQVRERSLAEDLRLTVASVKAVVAGRGAA